MNDRHLGPDLVVSALGLGCMGMSLAYGRQPEADSIRTLHRAIDIGVTFLDTAEVYGPYENEELIGRAIKGMRERVVIATKFGFKISDQGHGTERMIGLDSRPEHVRAVCDASPKRLGIDVIDLFCQYRVDPAVPIEDTVGAMADFVQAGKVRAIGLSEASAATLRRAHDVHPIAAVQSECSLWSREPEAEVLPTCRDLGIGFVPYSPLARGLLAGAIRDRKSLGEDDFRRTLPRFEAAKQLAGSASQKAACAPIQDTFLVDLRPVAMARLPPGVLAGKRRVSPPARSRRCGSSSATIPSAFGRKPPSPSSAASVHTDIERQEDTTSSRRR